MNDYSPLLLYDFFQVLDPDPVEIGARDTVVFSRSSPLFQGTGPNVALPPDSRLPWNKDRVKKAGQAHTTGPPGLTVPLLPINLLP